MSYLDVVSNMPAANHWQQTTVVNLTLWNIWKQASLKHERKTCLRFHLHISANWSYILINISSYFYLKVSSHTVKQNRKGCLEILSLMTYPQLKFLSQISLHRGNVFPLINFTPIREHFICWLQNRRRFSKPHKPFPD